MATISFSSAHFENKRHALRYPWHDQNSFSGCFWMSPTTVICTAQYAMTTGYEGSVVRLTNGTGPQDPTFGILPALRHPLFLGFSRYMLIMVFFSSRRLASASSYLLPTKRFHHGLCFLIDLSCSFFLFHSKRPRILGESDEQIRPRVFNTDTVFQKNGIQKSTLAATSLRYNSSPGFKFIQMFFVVITLQACLVRDRTCA
jgi:hypothetical protein